MGVVFVIGFWLCLLLCGGCVCYCVGVVFVILWGMCSLLCGGLCLLPTKFFLFPFSYLIYIYSWIVLLRCEVGAALGVFPNL